MKGKRIFTSHGLNTELGRDLIGKELQEENLGDKRILLISVPGYEIDEVLVNACKALGFKEENIVLSGSLKNKEVHFDIVYCTEGNTFEIVDYMRKNELFAAVKRNVENGAIYIGASAGAIIAGDDFELANDFDNNYLRISDYTGLGLFEGTIIPHYEPDELKRYIANTENYRISRYRKIYSVGYEEVVVMNGR